MTESKTLTLNDLVSGQIDFVTLEDEDYYVHALYLNGRKILSQSCGIDAAELLTLCGVAHTSRDLDRDQAKAIRYTFPETLAEMSEVIEADARAREEKARAARERKPIEGRERVKKLAGQLGVPIAFL